MHSSVSKLHIAAKTKAVMLYHNLDIKNPSQRAEGLRVSARLKLDDSLVAYTFISVELLEHTKCKLFSSSPWAAHVKEPRIA